ncbi:tRNA-dihydrouridine synthase family protein [soil metagenome]
MIKPLQLGNKIFPINIIQGPLAGVSCAPFRFLTWKYGKPAFSCTEMISCNTLIHQPSRTQQRFVNKHPQEGPVCFQLAATTPAELAEASKKVTAFGADLIDLNCGCPVKKIRGKGAGSRLLMDATRLYHLITAMKQNTHVPVSIKIRVDGHSNDRFNSEIAKVVSDAGADFLVVHGRHWTEHYETPCNYQQIQYFVEELTIPVIGNGDVACIDSLKKMFATGCAGVMIGRAGVGQPWLIAKLTAAMQNQHFIPPTAVEVGAIFLDHVLQLVELLGNEKQAILQARKITKYYARGYNQRLEFCEAINACENLESFTRVCGNYFGNL